MNQDDYATCTARLLDEAARIEAAKRPAYTVGSGDVLANFKHAASESSTSPGQALTVLMAKHLDAVRAALCHPEIPQAEPIIGRFADAVNYLKLGYALVCERDENDG